ncbi:AAA family ATPase [Sphingomonas sp. DG1-23]|uniref:AAA family ATPase n=1 Tax=Sphingomonas sp. DG1-23 TaxID=3068316 RepID=UPI00273EBC1A|nr:AAA family ATPase [Sphingomonas sp. DG1-23]MDP5279922.1 AAA family ATPase [Sphingomonas sp. DG1-23]
MIVARDFEDVEREDGGAAVRAAIAGARHMWPESAPFEDERTAGAPIQFDPLPFTWRDPATIPRRQFLYGFELRRKQASAVIGVGAGGKTTLKVGRALCMVTGKDFFGHRVWNGPHRVWLVNLEDEREEIEKTVHAFMKLWNLSPADLGDRLFMDGIDTGAMAKLKVAVEGERGGFIIQRPIVEATIEALVARRIDYLDVDPFVSCHSVDENNNGAIDAVSKEWVQVAHRADCAVSLAHHVRKPNGSEATAFDARGAVSMINAVRSVLVLQKMSKEVAQELCVRECDRKRYVSVYDDKNNKAPPAAAQDWYEFVSVGLGNGDDTGPEDSIGALQRWQAPNAFGGATARQLYNIQKAIESADLAETRKHSSSKGWAGKIVAYVLDMNVDDPMDRSVIKKRLDTWLASGALRSVMIKDRNHEDREHVEVGRWATLD